MPLAGIKNLMINESKKYFDILVIVSPASMKRPTKSKIAIENA